MDIMMILKAVILGIVEGLTEFLPVSSTGHMILVDEIIELSPDKKFTEAFQVIIQLGAILSVCCFFFKELWPFTQKMEDYKRAFITVKKLGFKFSNIKAVIHKEDKKKFVLWSKVIIAVFPALALGAIYSKLNLKEYLFTSTVVASTLIIYGIIIILLEIYNKDKKEYKIDTIEKISYKSAVLVGFFQCLALVPGTSRSAASIIGAMLIGFSRAVAAEFSFFLAIPTMAAAATHDMLEFGLNFTTAQFTALTAGFIVSFIVAYIVIKVFMDYVKKKDFKIFGYYRILLGIVVLALILTGVM
jgi:undecaprenyl-diphosphatase